MQVRVSVNRRSDGTDAVAKLPVWRPCDLLGMAFEDVGATLGVDAEVEADLLNDVVMARFARSISVAGSIAAAVQVAGVVRHRDGLP